MIIMYLINPISNLKLHTNELESSKLEKGNEGKGWRIEKREWRGGRTKRVENGARQRKREDRAEKRRKRKWREMKMNREIVDRGGWISREGSGRSGVPAEPAGVPPFFSNQLESFLPSSLLKPGDATWRRGSAGEAASGPACLLSWWVCRCTGFLCIRNMHRICNCLVMTVLEFHRAPSIRQRFLWKEKSKMNQ